MHVRVISNPSRLFSFSLTIGYRLLLLSISHGIRAYLRRKIQPSLPIAKLTLPCVAVLPCVAALPCAAALPYEVAAVLERRHLVLRRRRHQPVALPGYRVLGCPGIAPGVAVAPGVAWRSPCPVASDIAPYHHLLGGHPTQPAHLLTSRHRSLLLRPGCLPA